ncbi:hypothetical protein EJB05_13629, partial [Eragrostis curvula]
MSSPPPASVGFFSTVFPPPSVTTRNDGSRGVDGKFIAPCSACIHAQVVRKSGAGERKQRQLCSSRDDVRAPLLRAVSVHYGGRDYVYIAGHGQQDHNSHSRTTPPQKNNHDSKQQPDGLEEATRGDWWKGTAAITIIIVLSITNRAATNIQLINVAIHRSIKLNYIRCPHI